MSTMNTVASTAVLRCSVLHSTFTFPKLQYVHTSTVCLKRNCDAALLLRLLNRVQRHE